ncbi:DUF4352 domain-containing protein [Streptomyces sp. NPDC127084]|uniref:DUF4352 domain-containing protein n=1 Tax=Streptomyces sp. NPDC127084 TaxID=3347133 RepID=UPI00366084E3
MSQHYPQNPQQPGQQQPGWTGPGTPQQWGAPPQPPKKNSTGKIIGFGCLGVVGLFVVLGIVGAVAGGGSDDKRKSATSNSASAKAERPAGNGQGDAAKKPKPEEKAPVKITAKETAFTKSILADGSNYTSVLVTIANNSDDEISVNPLYFSITDSNGTKHTAEVGVDEKQIDTVKLAPGENVSGTITGKGKFSAKYVTYTNGLLGDPQRVDVS